MVELTRTVITPKIIARALHNYDGITRPEDMKLLPIYDRSSGERRPTGEFKPVEKRIEYRLIKETPHDENGELTLENMVRYFHKLRYDPAYYGKDHAELSGAATLMHIAHAANVSPQVADMVYETITSLEGEINKGEKECGGYLTTGGTEARIWLYHRAKEYFQTKYAGDKSGEIRR